MLGAETNVLLRLLVSDDLAQQRAVAATLERLQSEGETVVIGSLVLAEMAWVLTSVYGYDRAAVATAIEALRSTPPFVIQDRAAVAQALSWYTEGPADFADYLILALAAGQGSRSTGGSSSTSCA